MNKIMIGKTVGVIGLKGEIKVLDMSDDKERYAEMDNICLGDTIYEIERARVNKNVVVLKLRNVDDRNSAENLVGTELYINENDLKPLPEDTFYVRDLIGLTVVDEKNRILGRVSDVIQNAAQDLYEIKRETGKKVLVPAVKEFILDIDMEKQIMKIKILEGLLDL